MGTWVCATKGSLQSMSFGRGEAVAMFKKSERKRRDNATRFGQPKREDAIVSLRVR